MKTTRRGFIGGLLFAPFAPALMKAGFLREPRSWLWTKIDTVRTVVDGWQVLARGHRSDGSWFYVRHMVPEWIVERSYGFDNKGDIIPAWKHKHLDKATVWELDAFADEARHELESFLDPKCNCVVGEWCDLHQYLKPPGDIQLATSIRTNEDIERDVMLQKVISRQRAALTLGVDMEDGVEVVHRKPGETFFRFQPEDRARFPFKRTPVGPWDHVKRRSSYGKGLALAEKKRLRG